MPQMAPINWLILFFLFLSIFIFFIILNYFTFLYQPKKIMKTKQTFLVYWKW